MSFIIGRPWQFDLDATHDGRSNTYSFVHKGVHHVLKPMLDSAIKAEVFAPVKVKKKAVENIPEPRTALLQVRTAFGFASSEDGFASSESL